jgi:predicted transcriptional regulator
LAIKADDYVEDVRDWMASRDPDSLHQGFPVVDNDGNILGVVTRRNLLNLDLEIDSRVKELLTRPPVIIYDTNTAREAADHMVREQVGRLPVVKRSDPKKLVGIVSRSDLLATHARRLAAANRTSLQIELRLRTIPFSFRRRGIATGSGANGVDAPSEVPAKTPSEETAPVGQGKEAGE